MSNVRDIEGAAPEKVHDLWERMMRFVRDVREELKLTQRTEVLSFEVTGTATTIAPVPLLTQLTDVRAAVRCDTYERDAPDVKVSNVSMIWRKAVTGEDPGIVILDLPGLTNGTHYTVTVLLVGS